MKVTGRKRLEPSRYEAEWAYLTRYNELGKQKKPVSFITEPQCSGGIIVRYLGGSSENVAEWDDVYSEKGGQYEMTIHYMPTTDRKLEVDVNGSKTLFTQLESTTKNVPAQITLSVSLHQGYNVIRMGSAYTWAPDIDCFTLKKM